jgi:diguanylate cyclase (GGDEF)-like protein/PAS domain S-box-containing protein
MLGVNSMTGGGEGQPSMRGTPERRKGSFRSVRSARAVAAELTDHGSEDDYRSAVMATVDGILVVDTQGRICLANPSAEDLLGQGQTLIGHPFGFPLAAGDRFAELDSVGADGSHAVIEMHVGPITWSGQDAYVVTLRNITDRKLVERQLKDSEERYALAARGAHDGLWDWDLTADRLYTSPRWREIVGCGDGDMSESPDDWLERAHPDDIEELRAAVDKHLESESEQFVLEHRLQHKDGSYVPVLSRGVAVHEHGRPVRFAGSLTDLTTRQQLSHKALHDGLTDLGNRTLFIDHLENAIARERRLQGGLLFAVLFLDLDNFKLVNDSLGHAAGDALLVAVANRIQSELRSADICSRLGGDEFAILLEDVSDIPSVLSATKRIQQEIARPVELAGESLYTSASIGIVMGGDENVTALDVVRNADIAMYRAKRRGQGNLELFDRGMQAEALERLRLQTDLRRGVERSEFITWYQPIVNLSDWRITGFEALLRWRHPDGAVDAAERFVEVAEETGMIVPLSWQVLDSVCQQAKPWVDVDSSLRMSVNVSDRQFAQDDFIDQVEQRLAAAGIEGDSLQLEITERVVILDLDAATARMKRLHALGIDVLVDDFGTGQSSLTALHRLPIDGVKIDRSFVQRLESEEGGKIVETVLALAKSLGLRVIAEGVETLGQRQLLLDLGCDVGQGFLCAHALEGAEATHLLRDGKAVPAALSA